MKFVRKATLAVVVLFILASGGLLLVTAISPKAAEALRWRTRLISLKSKGTLSYLSWTDTFRAIGPTSMRPSAGNIEAAIAAALNQNAFINIRNPRTSEVDVEAGSKIFRSDCALCHGATGGGGIAPKLTAGGFRQGGSDWALFQTISRGVPGTAMAGSKLPEDSIWQIIAFMRSTILRPGPESDAGDTKSLERSLALKPVSFDRLVRASEEPENWLTYSGDYYSHRHSRLQEINSRNVEKLKVKWVFQMPTLERKVQASPLVVDGVMYVTEPPSNVLALDAETGRSLWSYQRQIPDGLSLCCGRVNRGVTILGSKVFVGTVDSHLVALDAKTGRVDWDVEVADRTAGYSITAAPLAVKDLIVVGVAGGETGVRGFLDAYSASTGKRVWRFYTVPGPGEPGHETWTGDSWKTGAAPTWLTGSYDPRLNLVYWGVGNPGPPFEGAGRAGDNLYSNCAVALDADSGKMRWYFQFTPHDEHDWDSVQIPVLLDAEFRGRQRQLMIWANRNAFYYVLDRQSGEFLLAKEFATQTWAAGIDSKGRPVVKPNSSPTLEGTLIRPEGGGATNWWSPSYSPSTGLFYVPVREDSAAIYFKGPVERIPGQMFTGSGAQELPVETGRGAVRALDPKTGEVRWEARLPSDPGTTEMGGLLSTAGNLVFGGNSEQFFALDATTGKMLWKLGGKIVASPVTYLSKGRQQVSIAIGRSIFTLGLD